MTKQRELKENEIAICQVDKENYIVLKKQRMINNVLTYIVQWWSEQMNYFWSNYDMDLKQALVVFYAKISRNITEKDFYDDITVPTYTVPIPVPNLEINEDKNLDEHFENRTDLSGLSDYPPNL